MPESYVSSAQRINEANDEIARLKAENEALKKQQKAPAEKTEEPAADEVIDLDKADYKELQKYAKDLGIDPNQKKAVLLEELKKAAAETAEEK
jgi:predicted  nucleic acid-binding Zn-ribbon protein